MMQASVNSHRIHKFWGRLAAGTMFSLSGFDVVLRTQNLKVTESPLIIRFNDLIEFSELTNPSSPLPLEAFRFLNGSDLLGIANTNSQLSDVVAEITGVKSTVCDPPKGKNHVMTTIKLDTGLCVVLSLFNSQAIALHRRLDSMCVNPRVIFSTNLNPIIVGGRLFLNATAGTHIYYDKKTGSGGACFNRLVPRETRVASAAPF